MDHLTEQHVEDLDSPVSEMEIVDAFTRMIFEDDDITPRELRIIQALGEVDSNVSLDSFSAIGYYLRALGVEEMIKLVTRIRFWLSEREPCAGAGLRATHPATLRRH